MKRVLKKNSIIEGIGAKKRCYILANGPSVKDIDNIERIADEFVITVNGSPTTTVFDKVKSNFHCLCDPAFFKEPNTYIIEELSEKLKGLNVLVRYKDREIAKILLPESNLFFYYAPFVPFFTQKIPNICHPIMSYNNVVQYAMNLSLHMGFKEIVLIGVDMTSFLEKYNLELNQPVHFFDYFDNDKQLSKIHEAGEDNEFYLKAYGNTFESFKIIKTMADNNGVRVFNANPKSFLDVFVRTSFENVIQ